MDYSRYFWQGQLTRLRPLKMEDAEASWLTMLDSPSRKLLQLGVELPVTVEQRAEHMARYAGCQDVDGLILFTIETLEGENVGGLSYHSRDRKNGHFSFGVTIGRPHWRKGYAADATRILLRYGFLERRYHKCNSACIASNIASIKLHQALGFREEGRIRDEVFYNGRYCDGLYFGLTFDEFEESDGPYRPSWMK
jgi:RimJ/RimL family protein N-acetyltransferase